MPEKFRIGTYNLTTLYAKTIALLQRLHAEDKDAGYDRQLFAVVSRRQSRILSDMLRQADVQLWQNNAAFEKLKIERETLLKQLFHRRGELAQTTHSRDSDAARQTQLRKQTQAQEQHVARVETVLWRDYRSYMELFSPQPVTVEQAQKELLQPGEVLLTFLLMPEVPPVVFVVSPRQFAMRQLAAESRTVEEHIKRIRTLFASVGKTTDTREQLDLLQRLAPGTLHALYQQLIEPVAELLHDARHILVVADGLLYSLPLELLVTHYDAAQQQRFQESARQAGRERPWLSQFDDLPYLGARYRFIYLPSLATLALRRQKPQQRQAQPVDGPQYDFIAFADPVFSNETSQSGRTPSALSQSN